MNKQNFTSIRVVYDRILRDPIFIGINFEAIIDYTVDFIEIVGCPNLFRESIVKDLEFSNYRFAKPAGLLDIVQLIIDEKPVMASTDSASGFTPDISPIDNKYSYGSSITPTYRISGDYIYLPVESGKLTMIYKSIPIDDSLGSQDYGLPMIEDDPLFMLALQSYIEVQWLRMLVRAGKAPGAVLDEAKQTYAFNVGRYDTHSKRLSTSEMEAISRMFRTPFNRTNEFSGRFKNLNSL